MHRYFIQTGKKKSGPYEVAELQSMQIKKDYAVWDPATSHWSKVGDVSELQVLFSNQTPTAPEEISIPQRVEISPQLEEVHPSQEVVEVKNYEPENILPKKEKRKLSLMGWIIILAFGIILLIAVYVFFLKILQINL